MHDFDADLGGIGWLILLVTVKTTMECVVCVGRVQGKWEDVKGNDCDKGLSTDVYTIYDTYTMGNVKSHD